MKSCANAYLQIIVYDICVRKYRKFTQTSCKQGSAGCGLAVWCKHVQKTVCLPRHSVWCEGPSLPEHAAAQCGGNDSASLVWHLVCVWYHHVWRRRTVGAARCDKGPEHIYPTLLFSFQLSLSWLLRSTFLWGGRMPGCHNRVNLYTNTSTHSAGRLAASDQSRARETNHAEPLPLSQCSYHQIQIALIRNFRVI